MNAHRLPIETQVRSSRRNALVRTRRTTESQIAEPDFLARRTAAIVSLADLRDQSEDWEFESQFTLGQRAIDTCRKLRDAESDSEFNTALANAVDVADEGGR